MRPLMGGSLSLVTGLWSLVLMLTSECYCFNNLAVCLTVSAKFQRCQSDIEVPLILLANNHGLMTADYLSKIASDL